MTATCPRPLTTDRTARPGRAWLDLGRRAGGAGRLVVRADPSRPAPHRALPALAEAPWSDAEDGWILGRVWDFDVFDAATDLASSPETVVLPRAASSLGLAPTPAPLTVVLAPEPCRGTSSSTVLGEEAWRRRAEAFIAASGSRCSACGRSADLVGDVYAYLDPEDPPPPAGQVDERVGVRRFMGWELTCPLCWLARHPGQATTAEACEVACAHVAAINNWDPLDAEAAVLNAWRTWRARSAHAWRHDFTALGVDTHPLV